MMAVSTYRCLLRSLDLFKRQLFPVAFTSTSSNETTTRNISRLGNVDTLESVLDILYKYGFSSKQIDEILLGYPEVAGVGKTGLISSIECWLSCQFGLNSTLQLLSTHPGLFSYPPATINSRFVTLSTHFQKSDLFPIFFISPLVIKEETASIDRKINYLTREMGVSKRQIVKYGLLGHSLEHIKVRHKFLLKAGLYHVFKSTSQVTSKNMHVKDILNTTEKEFCQKCPGLTLFEFEVFKELCEHEDD